MNSTEQVWIPHPKDGWQIATVIGRLNGKIKVKTLNGEVSEIQMKNRKFFGI
jgi:hypothetical protein